MDTVRHSKIEEAGLNSSPPSSLMAPISPPRRRIARREKVTEDPGRETSNIESAAIESGNQEIVNHLEYFSSRLRHQTRLAPPSGVPPRISIAEYRELYIRNQTRRGHHFIIHQHDHPVAGVHYDLRLQFSATSSISFAIMYGLPGNPNSQRPNRNATETRVHNLWNHLVETASPTTGSLLIWDTGEYEVLTQVTKSKETDSEPDEQSDSKLHVPENEKLVEAFSRRKIRLRLHGTRLPKGYTIYLRLPGFNNTNVTSSTTSYPQRHQKKPPRKRRRRTTVTAPLSRTETAPPASSSAEDESTPDTITPLSTAAIAAAAAAAAELGEEATDELIRRTNAYPGATNSIGSVHQRQWFLSLDRENSGFERCISNGKAVWKQRRRGRSGSNSSSKSKNEAEVKHDEEETRDAHGYDRDGFEPFVVAGRNVERSILTGRTADDVMMDEGVQDFIGRKGWRAVIE
ncbi:MAG: hypothetical protein M1825_005159 [Sarcosagium campestre]|nr:MAG: hypothetical protein M1825_005159 [Sarcosagium campestre]